jgi:Regulator of chromosome condensation (RCC1) repeat
VFFFFYNPRAERCVPFTQDLLSIVDTRAALQGLGDTLNRGESAVPGFNGLTVNLGAGRSAKAIDSGHTHMCAVLDNGSLLCWGNNEHGEHILFLIFVRITSRTLQSSNPLQCCSTSIEASL